MTNDELSAWPDELQACLDAARGTLTRVTVLRETDSTQDAARRLNARPGEVIVAGRQTRGRGRLGSAWADTADQGMAATFVLPRANGERLAFISAVATAIAAEALLGDGERIAIKWPNDLLARRRKLAGILIEQDDESAYVGIGMNVSQTRWPGDLADRAISLAECGVTASRLDALQSLMRAMNETLEWGDERVAREYHQRHLLRDQIATFRNGSETITGCARGLCLDRGLRVETDSGPRWLAAAATRVVAYSQDDRA